MWTLMYIAKAALVIFCIIAVAVSEKANAFQEMVKGQLMKSPKLPQMLEDPERMREMLIKISKQNDMPDIGDLDKLMNDLREGSKSMSNKPNKADGTSTKSEKSSPLAANKSSDTEGTAKKTEKKSPAAVDKSSETEGMATKKEKSETASKKSGNKKSEAKKGKKGKKEASFPAGGFGGMPGLEGLQELMTNPEKMKEAMDQLTKEGGLSEAMAKMKEDGHLDKMKDVLGGAGGGLDFDSMMNNLKNVDMNDMMSKLQSGEGMAEMRKNLEGLRSSLGGDTGDEEL